MLYINKCICLCGALFCSSLQWQRYVLSKLLDLLWVLGNDIQLVSELETCAAARREKSASAVYQDYKYGIRNLYFKNLTAGNVRIFSHYDLAQLAAIRIGKMDKVVRLQLRGNYKSKQSCTVEYCRALKQQRCQRDEKYNIKDCRADNMLTRRFL